MPRPLRHLPVAPKPAVSRWDDRRGVAHGGGGRAGAVANELQRSLAEFRC